MSIDLAGFLGPLTPEGAMGLLDSGTVTHLPRDGATPLADHLGWDLVSFLVARQSASPQSLRVYKAGRRLPAAMYSTRDARPRLDWEALGALARQGVGIVFGQVRDASPALHRLWAEAERCFRLPVRVGVVATFGKGNALRPHYDDHDIINLQTVGSKGWTFLGEPERDPHPDPAHQDGLEPGEATKTVTLGPGDILLVPRGHWHRCWSEEGNVQVSLLLERRTGRSFAEWLARRCGDLEGMGRSLPLRPGPEDVAELEADIKERMVAAIRGASLAAFLEERGGGDGLPGLLPPVPGPGDRG